MVKIKCHICGKEEKTYVGGPLHILKLCSEHWNERRYKHMEEFIDFMIENHEKEYIQYLYEFHTIHNEKEKMKNGRCKCDGTIWDNNAIGAKCPYCGTVIYDDHGVKKK